jgi:hypothetical protein
MSEATERLTASIVLVGKFNPAIFSPAWIARTELVDDRALEAAKVSVIHPEIAVFEIGGYSFDIRTERFSVEVASEPLVRALDATLVIFDKLLPHTPITAYGINYVEHFRLDSADRRVAFGRALAPLEPWGAWGAEIGELKGDLTSGVVDLTMVQTYDPAGTGERRVDVQPSAMTELANAGVFVSVNDHRSLRGKESAGAKPVMEKLQSGFDDSIDIARSIVDGLHTFAKGLTV